MAEKEVRARLKEDNNPNRLIINMNEEMQNKIKKYIETYVVKHGYIKQEEVSRKSSSKDKKSHKDKHQKRKSDNSHHRSKESSRSDHKKPRI